MVTTITEAIMSNLIVLFVLALLFLWIYLATSKKSLKDFILDIREALGGTPRIVYEEAKNKFAKIR